MLWSFLFLISFVYAQDCVLAPEDERLTQYAQEVDLIVAKLKHIRGKKAPACPELKDVPSTLLIAFEGASGFDPKSAYAQQLSKVYPYPYGPKDLNAIQKKKYDAITKKKPHSFHLAGAETLDYLNLFVNEDKVKANYYSQKHSHQAAECIIKLTQEAKNSGKSFKLKVFGYSMGGGASIELARELLNHGIQIDSLFTVEPVARSYRALPYLLGKGETEKPFARPPNIKNWINYYQKEDKRSLLFGIKGNSAKQADVSYKILVDDKKAHVEIMNNKTVYGAFEKWLED